MKTDRIDVTAARVGVVAVLYMVPATCQVGDWWVWVCMYVCRGWVRRGGL